MTSMKIHHCSSNITVHNFGFRENWRLIKIVLNKFNSHPLLFTQLEVIWFYTHTAEYFAKLWGTFTWFSRTVSLLCAMQITPFLVSAVISQLVTHKPLLDSIPDIVLKKYAPEVVIIPLRFCANNFIFFVFQLVWNTLFLLKVGFYQLLTY